MQSCWEVKVGLFAVGLLGAAMPLADMGHAVVLWLETLMGAQNALSTKISHGAGQDYACLRHGDRPWDRAGSICDPPDPSSTRLRLYGSMIVAFVAGGLAAIVGYRLVGSLIFCLIGAGLTALAGTQQRRSVAADGS